MVYLSLNDFLVNKIFKPEKEYKTNNTISHAYYCVRFEFSFVYDFNQVMRSKKAARKEGARDGVHENVASATGPEKHSVSTKIVQRRTRQPFSCDGICQPL